MMPTETAPTKLHAFTALVNAGLSRDEIMKHLKIARCTYYVWLREVREFAQEARKLMSED